MHQNRWLKSKDLRYLRVLQISAGGILALDIFSLFVVCVRLDVHYDLLDGVVCGEDALADSRGYVVSRFDRQVRVDQDMQVHLDLPAEFPGPDCVVILHALGLLDNLDQPGDLRLGRCPVGQLVAG